MDLAYALGVPPSGTTGGTPSTGAAGFFISILPLLVILVIFYFLLIKPQQSQQKKHKEMLSQLKKGDRVLTSGGLYGTVVGINEKDSIVVLRISDDVKVEIDRNHITSVKVGEEIKSE